MTTTCEGTWHAYQGAEDGENHIEVLRCSGCREWMVLANYGGFGPYPPELTLKEAVQAAITEYIQQRKDKAA